jgi:hypothetical protein
LIWLISWVANRRLHQASDCERSQAPYHAVIFSSGQHDELEGYAETAKRMLEFFV